MRRLWGEGWGSRCPSVLSPLILVALSLSAGGACAPQEPAAVATASPTSRPTPTSLPTPMRTPEYEAIPGAYPGIFYGSGVPSVQFCDRVGKGVAIRVFRNEIMGK